MSPLVAMSAESVEREQASPARHVGPEAPPSVDETLEAQVLAPPPVDREAEARARELAERAAFEAEWPLHAVGYHFLGQVRARPDGASTVVGYVRRGSRLRARPGLRGPGCARGWHEVPGAGFVCRGEGFLIGETPQSFEPSPEPPHLTEALPYPYAHVGREHAPLFWRRPSRAEEAEADALLGELRAAADARAARATAATVSAEEGADLEPDLEAPPGLAVDAVAPDAGVPAVGATTLPDYLRMRMLRGFYVSVDGETVDGDRRFFRTVRGNFVRAEVMTEATPPTMRGVVLGGAWAPPLAFVFRRGVLALTRDAATGTLRQADALEYHAPLLLSDEIITRRGSRYRVTRDGIIVRETAIRVVPLVARPPGVREQDRWFHVDVSEQTLVAYEGDRPVFATLVSTGRAGFDTPIGTYRIQSKHVSATMDDPDSATEAYSIEDVPWTMYFEGSYALHGAFWHDSFGHRRSHGCVNLAPADARWVFHFATPELPSGWHGVFATPRRVGTWVHITE